MSGYFIVSLDFELHWGVFDKRSVESYKESLLQVRPVIERLLVLADKYNVKLTFATVGFLFAKDKNQLLHYLPKQKPTYSEEKYSPYPLIASIGNSEEEDPFHYAYSVIKQIRDNVNHEIGTHTFSHFYCHHLGQTVEQFEDDLKSAIAIAETLDIKLESIVTPRNMMDTKYKEDKPYLEVCNKLSIIAFRGKEKKQIYNIHTTKFYKNWYLFKMLRMLDCYINITGYNTYDMDMMYQQGKPLNMPSSRFLRPFNNKLSFLEPLKVRRIKKAMWQAAKKGRLFHLWWHPHNFGKNTDKNFKNIEAIFKEYKVLNKTFGFKSKTMTSLAKEINAKHLSL